jgi:eukaryotic-like serine/threonine-protein kinase
VDRVLRYLTKIPPGPVVGVIVIVALWMMSGATGAAAQIPELEGLQVNPAIAQAAEDGFFTKVVFARSGGVAGTVVRQSPDELTIHDKGTTITLRVTKGAPQVKVPDVRGVEVEEARRRLDRGNVTVGSVTYRNDDEVQANKVITTVPAPNTLVDVNTKVDIIASA